MSPDGLKDGAGVPRTCSPSDYRHGPLAPFLTAARIEEVGEATTAPSFTAQPGAADVLFAGYRLQDIGDYRAALRDWLARVRIGGVLIVVVPHAFLYERQNMLPSRWRQAQCRLYTPRSLLEEVEEALEPNSYRVRLLADHDDGYDYAADPQLPPAGAHDVLLVLERIAPPAWPLSLERGAEPGAPPFAFEPPRTRVEALASRPPARILVLKLDHLGDFVMGLPALRALRAAFPEAHVTLVVGSWNEAIAGRLAIADEVLVYDVFPRNSNEEAPDVHARKAGFDALITGYYDLAVDLRVEADTRFLLRDLQATMKAGIGARHEHPYLEIFLPIDRTRLDVEAAWQRDVPLRDFHAQGECRRTAFQIFGSGEALHRERSALLWGPYWSLRAGDYLFEPHLDLDMEARPGLLGYDIAIDTRAVASGVLAAAGETRVPFRVERDGQQFEFRLWPVEEEPIADFRFMGGRLIRRGAGGVLHQSEYALLLVRLIELRLARKGLLAEVGAP